MGTLLLLVLAVTTGNFQSLSAEFPPIANMLKDKSKINELIFPFLEQFDDQVMETKLMLNHTAPNLNPMVVNKVLTTLKCASKYNVNYNNILTLIDYSLPSNQKRLWVFDVQAKKLLFHTYVSHGIKSGALLTNFFSNKYNSKASSIGVYQTQKAYYGRDGLSLRLDGLDRKFNDNASNRAVVMHSGWYVEERFIKKYGRPGRSWGCPALPLENSNNIINTIKDNSLLVIYYPSDAWFSESKFLNCEKTSGYQTVKRQESIPLSAPNENRGAILFAGSGFKSIKNSETKPVAVIAAPIYERIFHKAPLTRMLRRQINNEEYIAISTKDLNYLINNHKIGTIEQEAINAINFVIPVMKVVRGGYYETQMQFVNLGKIKDVKLKTDNNLNTYSSNYIVYFEGKPPITLNPSHQFIRWVGL